jgi:serine/threonine protein kinase
MRLHYMCSNCGAEMDVSDREIQNLEQTGLFQKRLQCSICNVFIAIPDARLTNRSEISGYRISSRVEVDGPREIYAAEHIQTHRKMELQILHAPFAESGEPSALFLNDMNRYMKIRHPNLISILDAGRTSEGIYFVAWQRIKNKSLEYRMWEGGALELKPALHLATLIGQVLEWLWTQHGLIYGHLSPRRIWIAPDKTVQLFNTILSPLVKDQLPSFPLDTLMAGMPGFLSPEILNGSTHLDCRSDMYALGATLYNMLTGTAPFCGLNPQQIQEAQASSSLPDPRTLRPDLPTAVVEFLKSTLAHDPSDRPQDWSTFLSQLASLQKDQPIPQPVHMASHSVLIQLEPSLIPPISKKIVIQRASRNPIRTKTPTTAPAANPSRAFFGILAVGLITVIAFLTWLATRVPPPSPPAKLVFRTTTNSSLSSTTITLPPQQPHLKPSNTVSKILQPTNSFDALYRSTQEYLKNNPMDYDGLLAQYDALLIMTETTKPHWHARILDERRGIEMTKSFALDRALEEIQQKTEEFDKNANYAAGISWLTSYQGVFSNQTSALRDSLCSNLVLHAHVNANTSRAKQQKQQATQHDELTAKRKSFLEVIAKAVLANNFEQARKNIQNWNTPSDLGWSKTQQDDLLSQLGLISKLSEKIMERYHAMIGTTVKIELINGLISGKLIAVENQVLTIQSLSADGEIITLPVSIDKIRPQDVFLRLASLNPLERGLLQGFFACQHNDDKLALASFTGMTNSLLVTALIAHIEETISQTREAEAQKALNAVLTLAGINPDKKDASTPIALQIDQTSFPDFQCLKIKEASQRFTELYGRSSTAQNAAPILTALNDVSPIVRKIDLVTLENMMNTLKAWKSGETHLLFSYRIDGALACLDLSENRILPDLSPLKILPFKELSFRKCGMTKLPSLEGFRINRLDLSDSAIVNLTGFKGASIDTLILSGTQVASLHVLKSVPVRVFHAENCENLSDLSGLATTNLTNIVLTGSAVSDLSPLENAPLISADFSNCTLINDLKPLSRCPLTELNIAGCHRISMIYALKGLPLRKLNISGTKVSDLGPLTEMPLETLILANARNITDLTPLANNKSLQSLTLPTDSVNVTCLRQHKTLEAIGFPAPIRAALFWQKQE